MYPVSLNCWHSVLSILRIALTRKCVKRHENCVEFQVPVAVPRITQTNMSDELQKATCNSKPVCKQNSALPRGCFRVFQRIRLQKSIALHVSETR